MSLKNIFFTGILTVIIIVNSFGNEYDTTQYSFSLKQCIEYAFANQNKVQNALLDEQLIKNKIRETRGIGFPQISGNIDVKNFIEQPTSLIPAEFFGGQPGTFAPLKFGTKYNATVGFDATQLLFDANFYFVAPEVSKTYMDISKKNTERTKIETAATVSKAYYSVIVNDERMKLMNANIARVKKLLDDTRALNESGFVEKIDVDRLTVTYNNLLVEEEKINRLLALSQFLLKYQMGMDINAGLKLTDTLENISLIPNNLPDSINYFNRVEYSLLQAQYTLACLERKRNYFNYFPSLMAYGNLSTQAQRNEFDFFEEGLPWYPVSIVGVRLTVPIFNGLQKHYRIQQSKISILKTENDLKFLEQSIDLELAAARINLENTASTLSNQRKNIQLAEEVFRISKLKYEQGVGSNLEVLNSETALKEAQTNYFNALFEALVSKVDYDKASGILLK